MKHFKIYITDDQGREVIRLLNTEKSYDEVREQYGRCEELFDSEVEGMRAAGVIEIDDQEVKIGNAGMFHTLEPVLQDLYNKKAKIQGWIDALNDDPTPEEFQRILQEIQND